MNLRNEPDDTKTLLAIAAVALLLVLLWRLM